MRIGCLHATDPGGIFGRLFYARLTVTNKRGVAPLGATLGATLILYAVSFVTYRPSIKRQGGRQKLAALPVFIEILCRGNRTKPSDCVYNMLLYFSFFISSEVQWHVTLSS